MFFLNILNTLQLPCDFPTYLFIYLFSGIVSVQCFQGYCETVISPDTDADIPDDNKQISKKKTER